MFTIKLVTELVAKKQDTELVYNKTSYELSYNFKLDVNKPYCNFLVFDHFISVNDHVFVMIILRMTI